MSTADTTSRFLDFGEIELQQLLDNKDSDGTKKTIKASVCVLKHYLGAKGKSLTELEEGTSESCDETLRKFYAETRKEDGSRYAKKSMITIRYGLQKHFLRHRSEDIINSAAYKNSNAMFKAVLVQLKKEGIGESVSKQPLTPEDLKMLYDGPAFDINNAWGLQRKVMFEYLYFFCNRGRENLRELKKGDFTIGMDSTGREFVTVSAKQTKNHRGDDTHDVENKQGRMYDKPGNPQCPVQSLKKYVDKLHPDNPNFWQRPKKNVCENDEKWYDNAPIGKNALFSFMQRLSQDYKLSKPYTNHCVRATSITTLDHNNIKARHIMGVSGHKSENSIKSYSANLSDSKKRQMSDILSDVIPPKTLKVRTDSVCNSVSSCKTVSRFCEVQDQASGEIQDFLEMENLDIDKLLQEIKEHDLIYSIPSKPASNENVIPGNFNISNCNVTINFSK